MGASSVPHPIAAGLVAVLMLGGIGFGVYSNLKAPQNEQLLERTLFDPYFKALSSGHVDEAWERYTTPSYKQLFPVERYREHWAQTFSHAGRMTKLVRR